MLNYVLKKIFGTKNDRELKAIQPIVAAINEFEPRIKPLSDAELQKKTEEFRERMKNGEAIDSILPEAFAVVREASIRVLGMRHFDVQMVGGIVLHRGKIAEMKTGEGKTLVATLPVYLNAISGRGVHVVTVNDYLARRDSEWMGRVYRFLGLSVGVIVHGLSDTERQAAYNSDVAYGTNNEFGFDYLRDNMKYDSAEFVQRKLHYGIVDEVDSILIDEARTPLIISGQAERSTDLYYSINRIVPSLQKDKHFTMDEKSKTVSLSEEGAARVESLLSIENLFDPRNINILHHINQALRAHIMFKRDVDYVVRDGKIMIVDEFTGRLMPGRRWSDGLHQAIEAKENVTIENENQTLATVTFQNYFRMYEKLAGMTGTADTEAEEFAKIYNLDVMIIPTNKTLIRKEFPDIIYRTEKEKFAAAVEEIKERHEKGQPVLVGTIAIEKSERLSAQLKRNGIPHHVLNAKYHDKEAEIISQAGRKGAVTVSTNMAGRGTDIMLGGNPEFLAKSKFDPEINPSEYAAGLAKFKASCAIEKDEVIAAGGLHIMGTERHEARRIDNQLRGRSGRQGDPGSSIFYLSLEDDLLRIFGGEKISALMSRFGMEEGEPLQHPWLARAIANAQKRVEGQNFSIRKTLLEYDDVMNHQRTAVYSRRREYLTSENNKDTVLDMIDEKVTEIVDEFVPDKSKKEELDTKPICDCFRAYFNFDLNLQELPDDKLDANGIGEFLYEKAFAYYEAKEQKYGNSLMRYVERIILLQTLDAIWKDHLLQMDHLKEGIGLRGYAQKDPLVEYKKEGYALFGGMLSQFAKDVIEKLFRVEIKQEESVRQADEAGRVLKPVSSKHTEASAFNAAAPLEARGDAWATHGTIKREAPKVGRNDPCPCGSGKKFKKCCGINS